MPCRDESRLSAWLDGELPPAEVRDVEAHVHLCAPCRDVRDAILEVRSLLASELEPDPAFVVRFRARRDEVSIASWWTWRELALRLIPLSAAVLLLALLAAFASSGDDNDLQALELEALGSLAPFSTTSAGEPVLSIALEPFPADGR